MSDDSDLSDDAPSPPAPKKPPVAIIAGGAAVALLAGLLALRGRGPATPTPSRPPNGPTRNNDFDASVRPAPPPPTDGSVRVTPDVWPPPLDVPPLALLATAPGAGPDVLRIFAPLRPGSMLGPARIDRISVVVDGRIMVDISVGERRGTLAVMLHSPAASQLVRAGPYVVYLHGAASPELIAATPLIADALRQSGDAGVAVPEGLRPFARDPGPR
ncbi:MAG: hypothetical protein U0325_33595 [Polyangiales bacterium]